LDLGEPGPVGVEWESSRRAGGGSVVARRILAAIAAGLV
jgi:hypothetical protein